MTLENFGWQPAFQAAFDALEHDGTLVPARVVSAQREQYRLRCEAGYVSGTLGGRLRHEAAVGDLPVVGDWVAVRGDTRDGSAVVHALLPRLGALKRQRAGTRSEPQLLAANVDVAFVMSSLNHDWNPRRVERALALIWESGAQPVLLLSKLDLCADASEQLRAARAVALHVPVHALSTRTGEGMELLAPYLGIGRTAVLIGSSGVGKSTLANQLLGVQRAATGPIREGDDRGRHTTTQRELFELPGGGLLIDTPGMRELGLFDAETGLKTAFEDVEQLVAQCRFADCRHAGEPGCAVSAALEDGGLATARLAAYDKLRREEAHHARRSDQRLQQEFQRSLRKRQQSYRKTMKSE
jgi:ribosome biogenesis GTPase